MLLKNARKVRQQADRNLHGHCKRLCLCMCLYVYVCVVCECVYVCECVCMHLCTCMNLHVLLSAMCMCYCLRTKHRLWELLLCRVIAWLHAGENCRGEILEGIVGNKSGALVSVIPIIITVAPPALPHEEGFFGYQCLVKVLPDEQNRFCLDAMQSNLM